MVDLPAWVDRVWVGPVAVVPLRLLRAALPLVVLLPVARQRVGERVGAWVLVAV